MSQSHASLSSDLTRLHGLPAHVLLTKADKLKRGPALQALQHLQGVLDRDYPQTTASLFSAAKGTGVDALHDRLDEWLFDKT